MQKYIFLKIKPAKELSYTALSDLLRSEGLIHIYNSVARKMRLKKVFVFGDMTIKKIELVHTKYKK